MKFLDRFSLSKPEKTVSRAEFRRTFAKIYLLSTGLFLLSLIGFFWAERFDRPDISVCVAVIGIVLNIFIARGMKVTPRMRTAFPGENFKLPILEAVLSLIPVAFALTVYYLACVETGGPRGRWIFGPGRKYIYAAGMLQALLPVVWIYSSIDGGEPNIRLSTLSQFIATPTSQQIVLLGDEIKDSRMVFFKTSEEATSQLLNAANSLRPTSVGVMLLTARGIEPLGRSPASKSPVDSLRMAKAMVTFIKNKEPDSGFLRFSIASLLSPVAFFEAMLIRCIQAPFESGFGEKYLSTTEMLLGNIEKRSPEAKREVASLRAEVDSSRFKRRIEAMKNSPYRFW